MDLLIKNNIERIRNSPYAMLDYTFIELMLRWGILKPATIEFLSEVYRGRNISTDEYARLARINEKLVKCYDNGKMKDEQNTSRHDGTA